jgi:D-alanyl-D-alanine carboxypeptidase (penicillin-binding protein 5/6)
MSTRRIRILAAIATGTMMFAVAFAGPVAAQPETTPPTTTPFKTPETDNCPNKSVPPKAIDESEVAAPGQTEPSPLPVPDQPVGGAELGRCGTVTPDGAPPLPKDISATAWVLSDLDTGKVIAAKDSHGRYRPASTIKVLLSIVALRELNLSKTVVGTTDDADADGTRVGIGPGGRYTNDQLMHALVMASGNDAAHAIATQLGGVDATVQKMNDEAKALGATDTRTATPAGLDGPGMSCSAYDLALFFRQAMTIPKFADLIHTQQIDFPGFPADPRIKDDKDHPGFPIGNDNQLLYNYDGALGGKTGYTDDARQTFVAGAERGGRRLAITLMKADVLPIRPWEQAARLLDYGFALDPGKSVGDLVHPGGGDTPSAQPSSGDATLAAPPASQAAERPITGTTHGENYSWMTKVVLVIGGLLVVTLLLLAASALNQRKR